MGFGYLSAAIIALIVLLAFRKYTKDRALWRRVKKNLPRTGAPTRGAIRREKKRMNQSEADETERASAAQKDKKMRR